MHRTPLLIITLPFAPQGSLTLLALDFTSKIVTRASTETAETLRTHGGQINNFSASSQFTYLMGVPLMGVHLMGMHLTGVQSREPVPVNSK